MNWGNPQFYGVKEAASNIVSGEGDYSDAMFKADFPQFYSKSVVEGETVYTPLVPTAMLELFISEANAAIQPSRWGDGWRYAAGLYVAHNCALYLKSYADESASAANAAASGATVGLVSSAKLGDSSVSYDNDALISATEKWGTLNATQYGQQLATRARLVGMGGSYAL